MVLSMAAWRVLWWVDHLAAWKGCLMAAYLVVLTGVWMAGKWVAWTAA